jgi:hypothetical protein
MQMYHAISHQGLPGVGPRRDVPGWVAFQHKLAQEVADGDAGEVGVSRVLFLLFAFATGTTTGH